MKKILSFLINLFQILFKKRFFDNKKNFISKYRVFVMLSVDSLFYILIYFLSNIYICIIKLFKSGTNFAPMPV